MIYFREIHKVLLALSVMQLPKGSKFHILEYETHVHVRFRIGNGVANVSIENDFINGSRPSRLVDYMSTRIKPLTKQNNGGMVVEKVE